MSNYTYNLDRILKEKQENDEKKERIIILEQLAEKAEKELQESKKRNEEKNKKMELETKARTNLQNKAFKKAKKEWYEVAKVKLKKQRSDPEERLLFKKLSDIAKNGIVLTQEEIDEEIKRISRKKNKKQ